MRTTRFPYSFGAGLPVPLRLSYIGLRLSRIDATGPEARIERRARELIMTVEKDNDG